jgi:diguanylate cyclase (GGDEF)-like protein
MAPLLPEVAARRRFQEAPSHLTMSQDQVLLTILGVGVLATVLLVGTIGLLARSLRRSRSSTRGSGIDEDAREAAAIEAFVESVSADTGVHGRPRPLSAAIPTTGETLIRRVPVMRIPMPGATDPPEAEDLPEAEDPEPSTTPAWPRPVATPESAAARIEDPATWARTVREESARVARFGHPVTVVMAELPHLDVLADRLGRDVADRVVSMTARLLVTESRAVDCVARLGDARFGILILETDEMAAGSFVERVRAAADTWLVSAGLSIRLSLGWASPVEGGDVMAAASIAQQRMYEAARR